LQRTIGNQAAKRLLGANAEGLEVRSDTSSTPRLAYDFSRIPIHSKAPVRLQAKLTVNAPGDIYEQEADRVSEQDLSMPEPALQRTCACNGGCHGCRNEQEAHEHLQTKSVQANDTGETEAPPIVRDVLRSSGQPLDTSTREFMEPRFGHDFSQVRLHTDPQAAESARAVNALAYTVGRHVVLGAGQYAPGTNEGRKLLAHELTHVVQQSAVASEPAKLTIGDPHDSYEREAEAGEDMLSHQHMNEPFRSPVVQRISRPVIMRSLLFRSTLEICRSLRKSREFHVSEGGLSVTANASWGGSPEWQGTEPPDCGSDVYNIQLSQKGLIFDTHLANREYTCGAPFTRTWGNLPEGDYYLTIWTGNTNPTCCLTGNIEVSQQGRTAGETEGAAGRKLCGPDVTQWLIRQIATNAKSEVVAQMKKDNTEDWKGVDLGALTTWYNLVKTGAKWDFKKDLGDAINLAPCRQNCSGKLYSITLDGQCMTYEAAANIHFGYVGRAAGFTEERLLSGASDAQVSEGRGETKDDPRDVEAIKKGFELFNAGSPNGLNKSGLKANYYQNLPAGDGDPKGCEPCPTKI
jgi:hypothetical protein